MSCEAGLTDSHCNEQTTDNPRGEAGATHKAAFRELKNDIETANAILKAAIEDAVEGLKLAVSSSRTVSRTRKTPIASALACVRSRS